MDCGKEGDDETTLAQLHKILKSHGISILLLSLSWGALSKDPNYITIFMMLFHNGFSATDLILVQPGSGGLCHCGLPE